jgi:hypothetical protein
LPCAGWSRSSCMPFRRQQEISIQGVRHHPPRSRSTDGKATTVLDTIGRTTARNQTDRSNRSGESSRNGPSFLGTAARDTTFPRSHSKNITAWSRPRSEWHPVPFRAVFRPIRIKKLFRLSPIEGKGVMAAPQSPIPSELPTRMPEDRNFEYGHKQIRTDTNGKRLRFFCARSSPVCACIKSVFASPSVVRPAAISTKCFLARKSEVLLI